MRGLPLWPLGLSLPEMLKTTYTSSCLTKGQGSQGLYPWGLRATLEALILGLLGMFPFQGTPVGRG